MKERPNDMPWSMWLGLKPRKDFIADFTNETDWKDGYWVYLKPGFVDSSTEMHLIHEQTVKAVVSCSRRIIQCECEDCKREIELHNKLHRSKAG